MERLKLPGLALLGLLALSVALPAAGANTTWTVAGSLPAGGLTSRIVIDPVTPSTLYVAAQDGLYRSTDSGASWTRIFKTLDPPSDFAIDPQNRSILYVMSPDGVGGIYKTTDGGATWVQMDSGILGTRSTAIDYLVSVAVDPVNEGVVYVGSGNTGVYKSTDGGAHWTQSNSGIVMGSTIDTQVLRLVVDPVSPAVLYAFVIIYNGSATTTYLYKSADSGATWTVISTVPHFVSPVDVEIDPADHTHLIAVFGNSLEESHNSGTLFTGLYTSVSLQVIGIDPSNSNHILVGSETSLYVSSNGSTFSTVASVPSNGIGGIAFDPVTPSNIYLGSTGWGVLKSSDGGASWSQSTSGIPNLGASQLLEGADGILYMSTYQGGIYKSLDQGATWTEVGTGFAGSLPAAAEAVVAFAQDPTAPDTLYAGNKGLFVSTDGGDSWKESDTGMPSVRNMNSLAIDPEVPTTLYAGMEWFDGAYEAGIYKSVNGGASWVASSTGLTFPVFAQMNAIAVDPHHSSVVYAAPIQNGLFKSVDGGASWTESDTGMGKVDIFALVVDATNSSKVYVSAVEGVYKSTDGGATWTASSTRLPGIPYSALLIDPVNPSVIYLSAPWYGEAYVSTDSATTWQPLNNGALAASSVSLGATLIDPVNHTHVYAAGTDGKFYVQGAPATAVANGAALHTTPETSVGGTLTARIAYGIQTLSFSVVQKPAHGQVNLDASTGKFSYTPAAGYLGADSFTFKATDQWGGMSNVATESLTVADVTPAANAGTAGTTAGVAVAGTLSGTPSYGAQTLSFSLVTQPAHGTMSLNAGTGQFNYTPAAGFVGSDSFTFKVTDQFGTASSAATEQVTVADVAPTASNGRVTTPPDTVVFRTLSASRAYPAQTLNFSLVSQPAHGTVSFAPSSGQFRYTPATGFAGSDSFTFKVTDAYGAVSSVATETVTVNDLAPTAVGVQIKVFPSSSNTGFLSAIKAYVGQVLSYSVVNQPLHGNVTITNPSTGAYTYTVSPQFRGQDSFTFQVVDQWGTASNIATVSVKVK